MSTQFYSRSIPIAIREEKEMTKLRLNKGELKQICLASLPVPTNAYYTSSEEEKDPEPAH